MLPDTARIVSILNLGITVPSPLCCKQELFPEHLRFSGQELRDKAGLQSTLKGWFSKKGASEDDKSAEDITALEVCIDTLRHFT